MNKGFEAVYNKYSEVLILGSFPSVKSREVGFYYGNKRNRFWSMLEQVFDIKINDNKNDKITFLHKHKIALYDVVEESNLEGSADDKLIKSSNKIADISFLLKPHTNVSKIICNGKAAYNLLTRNFKTDIEIIYLPSTSPANVSFDYMKWEKELKKLRLHSAI